VLVVGGRRDAFWSDGLRPPEEKERSPIMSRTAPGKAIALHHVVRPNDDFRCTARALYDMVRTAAQEHPGRARHLHLDVQGHANPDRGFDPDAYELMTHFLAGVLAPYVSEFTMHATNPHPQREDVPPKLEIR
jgi:hypothetical protein